MASYQIPQFLDSGDKIFLGMNIRQFAYFLVGFFFCVVIFNTAYGTIGNFAIIPIVPIGLLTAYISLGKFNGRDSEIYILNLILFLRRPKLMSYSRQPDLSETFAKYKVLTINAKEQELTARMTRQTQINNDPLANFDAQSSSTKATTIQNIGRRVDQRGYNVNRQIVDKEVKIELNREMLGQTGR